MGPLRSLLLAAALAPLAGACHLAPAHARNLSELHEPDGRHARRGELKGAFGYFFTETLRRADFRDAAGNGGSEGENEERIEDPPGECLDNLLSLAACVKDGVQADEKVVALLAENFAWLVADCPYALSRERCAMELGRLTVWLQARGPSAGEPASVEAVQAAFTELVRVTAEVRADPALAGNALAERCRAIAELPLEREGALRLLRGVNRLLAPGERGAVLAPLRELRLELARQNLAFGVRRALADGEGRVRAAGLEAGVRAFPEERTALLEASLGTPPAELREPELVLQQALDLLARYGEPPPPEGSTPEAARERWITAAIEALRASIDGPTSSAACDALARLTGDPPTLLPEVWMARWRARSGDAMEDDSATGAAP